MRKPFKLRVCRLPEKSIDSVSVTDSGGAILLPANEAIHIARTLSVRLAIQPGADQPQGEQSNAR